MRHSTARRMEDSKKKMSRRNQGHRHRSPSILTHESLRPLQAERPEASAHDRTDDGGERKPVVFAARRARRFAPFLLTWAHTCRAQCVMVDNHGAQ